MLKLNYIKPMLNTRCNICMAHAPVTSILVNKKTIIAGHCNVCLFRDARQTIKTKCASRGYCYFCKSIDSGEIIYRDFYCKNCLYKLASFITDRLEDAVNNA